MKRAVKMCEILAATLVEACVKFSNPFEVDEKIDGVDDGVDFAGNKYPFQFPGQVLKGLGAAELGEIMETHNVILGFVPTQEAGSETDSQLSLLILGQDPLPAVLALLVRIQELIPGCLGETLELPSQFGATLCAQALPDEKAWVARLEKAMQVGHWEFEFAECQNRKQK